MARYGFAITNVSTSDLSALVKCIDLTRTAIGWKHDYVEGDDADADNVKMDERADGALMDVEDAQLTTVDTTPDRVRVRLYIPPGRFDWVHFITVDDQGLGVMPIAHLNSSAPVVAPAAA